MLGPTKLVYSPPRFRKLKHLSENILHQTNCPNDKALTSQSPEVRAVLETIRGQSAASGPSSRLVTILPMWLGSVCVQPISMTTECSHGSVNGLKLHGNNKIYDDDDNDNKPSDHEIDVSESSFFAGPQKTNLRVNS